MIRSVCCWSIATGRRRNSSAVSTCRQPVSRLAAVGAGCGTMLGDAVVGDEAIGAGGLGDGALGDGVLRDETLGDAVLEKSWGPQAVSTSHKPATKTRPAFSATPSAPS